MEMTVAKVKEMTVAKAKLGSPIRVAVKWWWPRSRVIVGFWLNPKEEGIEIVAISQRGLKDIVGFLPWDEWGKLSSFVSLSKYPDMRL